MAQQGAALQSYNNELVKSIEVLLQRREGLNKQIELESREKVKLETEKKKIEERLATVENSLQTKLNTKAEYDKVINDAEQAYVKILESSQLLLNVVKVKSQDLETGKTRHKNPDTPDTDQKMKNLPSTGSKTELSPDHLYTQLPQ
eukprot:TRINITY_DN49928_c0_g1_i1.p1 TRINITY_DN49928_c0_g1~~TRINITY_DN49928_c0_g1_i1.p1  ORF type:complete len:146 (-),score=35.93 TRINITY_DN49928_c0_g1_i1:36-473(-)